MRKIYFPIISFIMLMCSTMTVWAVAGVQPPVVNQNLGMPDTQFYLQFDSDDPAKGAETCKRCHKPEIFGLPKPDGIPNLKSTYLPNRHHKHIYTEIAGGPEQPPNMDVNEDGIDDTHYQCLNCHIVDMSLSTRPDGIVINFRDCLNCHVVTGLEDKQKPRTVHHDTPKAFNGQCGDCHGYLVRNLDAGMPPASYQPSIITPWPSGKEHGDPTEVNRTGTAVAGNCNYCHNSENVPPVNDPNWSDPGTPDDTSPFSEGFGPVNIFPNFYNHHATGVPNFSETESTQGSPCQWCHWGGLVAGEPNAIRGCQRCHDIQSLHSIEADVDGDGISPGNEDPYNGHIGNQSNCWGCHGFDREYADTLTDEATYEDIMNANTTATVPQLEAINATTWPAGTGFDMTVVGSGFSNTGYIQTGVDAAGNSVWEGNHLYESSVQLTDADGNATVLEPFTKETTRLFVTIPGTLAAGSYQLQIKKADKLSNPITVFVIPTIDVLGDSATCFPAYNNLVIITGDQFSQYLGGPESGTSLVANGVATPFVYRWNDRFIAARFIGGCPSEIEINNVFDSTVVPVELR